MRVGSENGYLEVASPGKMQKGSQSGFAASWVDGELGWEGYQCPGIIDKPV